MKNNFKPGDLVKVLSLKQTGTVTSISNENSAKVAIGSLVVRCKISDLQKQTAKDQKINQQKPRAMSSQVKSSASIDLHGCTSKVAKEMLLQFISDAVVSGHPQVSVIHGHGNGTLKSMVHTTLSELDMVASFRHPINNTAETKVYFR